MDASANDTAAVTPPFSMKNECPRVPRNTLVGWTPFDLNGNVRLCSPKLRDVLSSLYRIHLAWARFLRGRALDSNPGICEDRSLSGGVSRPASVSKALARAAHAASYSCGPCEF